MTATFSERLGEGKDGLLAVLSRARTIGLLGPGPVDDHIEHAGRYVRILDVGGVNRGIDLGSGAGVPGLVLALAFPLSSWTLLDAAERRVEFLQGAIEELGLLERVTVVRGRAELMARNEELRHQFDVATARGFGPPAVTAECATGFLRLDGRLVVSEPPEGSDRWAPEGLRRIGMARVKTNEPFMAVLRQEGLCPETYPRRVGIPDKRPLF